MDNYKEISAAELKENAFKLIGKDWMLVSAQKNDITNAMTASWGGLGVMWGKDVAFVVIRPQRYTKEFVDNSDNFSLSFFDDSYKKTLSYFGTVSGRDEDKIAKSELTLSFDNSVPFFEEAKTILFCKKLYVQNFDEKCFLDKEIIERWYPQKDYHTLYIAEITKVLTKQTF